MSYGTVQAEKMTTESGYSLGAGNASSFKNRIINGEMDIDQRNNGASVTINTWTIYPVDRFNTSFRPSTGTANGQQVSDAPPGFSRSLRLTQVSATAADPNDVYYIAQKIEGYNSADFNWGTANAKTVTVSFWVKSSVTGTYSFTLQNINGTRRSYVTTYTINAANTWEQKTITIAGDTSGIWETTNSSGITVIWDLGSGSSYQTSTLNAWQTANVFQSSSATRWIGNSGATFFLTGVQLEVGTVATSFDFRSYGTELALCQRYALMAMNGIQNGLLGFCNGSQAVHYVNISCPVPLRGSPSVTQTVGAAGGGPSNNASNLSTYTGVSFVNWSNNGNTIQVGFSLNSTPTQQACMINPNTGFVFISSEL